MNPRIANMLGVAATTISVLAFVMYGYAVTLPYRLSPTQLARLEVSGAAAVVGPVLALILGAAALLGDARSRRYGLTAITLSVLVLLSAVCTVYVHSVSHFAS